MKLKNETNYDTATLRKIVVEAHRRLAKHEGRLPTWSRIVVTVNYARQRRGVSGLASHGGGWIKLHLTRDNVDPARVAQLAEHELLHAYGRHHGAGFGHQLSDNITEYLWAREMVDVSGVEFGEMLVEGEPVVKPKPSPAARRQVKLTRTDASIDRWTAKLQRAERALRRLHASRKRLSLKIGEDIAAAKPKRKITFA